MNMIEWLKAKKAYDLATTNKTSITSLSASVTNNTNTITALNNSLNSLTTSVNNNSSSLTALTTTTNNNSSSISTLTTTTNNNSSSITTLNGNITTINTKLNLLDLTNPTNGYVLTYDSTTGKFQSKVVPTGTGSGATSLDGLSDVDVTTTPPAEGNVLTYTSGVWQPEAPSGGGGGISLTPYDSSDVILTDTSIPSNVTNLHVIDTEQTSLAVEFTESVSSDTASYNVYNGSTFLTNIPATHAKVLPLDSTLTGLTAGTAYTLKVTTKDNYGNESLGSTVFGKTLGTQALSMNGTSDYFQLPTLTFDKIALVIDISKLPAPDGHTWYTIMDAHTGMTGGSFSIDSAGNLNKSYWSNALVNNSVNDYLAYKNGRISIVGIVNTPQTDNVTFFANYNLNSFTKGNLYQIAVYNQNNLIGFYDFTTQFTGTTVTDLSGNNNSGTLTGGTWITP